VLFLLNRVTVGICAYNEESNIAKLLENVLCEQDLSGDCEVIVVCSGCTDNTLEQVREWAAKDPRVKPYFEAERSGKASAVNYIFAHAVGDVIIFVSADTLPYKMSFPKLMSKLKIPNVGIVSGNPVPVNSTRSLVGRVVHLMWRFHGHVFAELNDAGLARHATEVFCIRKGIVKKIPAETVNDDAYIAVSAKKKGWFIKYSGESKVSICGPKTYREYFQQRRRVIFGHYQLRKLTGESPQYLVHMMPLHPVRAVKLYLWLAAKYDPVTLGIFLLTEFMVNAAAMFDFASGKAHGQWTALPSTKTVFP
jgi:cellulose synthase/poly-beta-1,6-N-acetylglucosamine synthase-like glycosyltransferase